MRLVLHVVEMSRLMPAAAAPVPGMACSRRRLPKVANLLRDAVPCREARCVHSVSDESRCSMGAMSGSDPRVRLRRVQNVVLSEAVGAERGLEEAGRLARAAVGEEACAGCSCSANVPRHGVVRTRHEQQVY